MLINPKYHFNNDLEVHEYIYHFMNKHYNKRILIEENLPFKIFKRNINYLLYLFQIILLLLQTFILF